MKDHGIMYSEACETLPPCSVCYCDPYKEWTSKSHLSTANESHFVNRHNKVFVDPSLIFILHKGERENSSCSFLSASPPSQSCRLAIDGAAGQQVGGGGSWGGSSPDV